MSRRQGGFFSYFMAVAAPERISASIESGA
jgi:hypothetical protein